MSAGRGIFLQQCQASHAEDVGEERLVFREGPIEGPEQAVLVLGQPAREPAPQPGQLPQGDQVLIGLRRGRQLLLPQESTYGGKSVLSHLPTNVHLISRVHPKGALSEPAPAKTEKTKGRPRKKGIRLPGMKPWAEDSNQPWSRLDFDQFGLHASLAVKTIPALYLPGRT